MPEAWDKEAIAKAAREFDHLTMDSMWADLKRAREALRHISATADTLSPQEFINVCADGIGADRHEYAGECQPNTSLTDLRIMIGIVLRAVADLQRMGEGRANAEPSSAHTQPPPV